ncbi:MAG: two-component system response regulator [Spirochaetota bacterium]
MEPKAKILVVDDEMNTLLMVEEVLSPLNYEVIFAKDGVEALERVEKHPPDVILLDIMMPRMNGTEVVKKLKSDEKSRLIPVVMLTGLKDLKDRIRSIDAGADDFLSKPVDISELRTRVKSLLKVKSYNDYMLNYQKKLENEVAVRTRQLKAASLDTIYRLSRAAEYRDEDTGNHIRRMSNYAAAIYRKLGKSDKEAETILYAAPMHDIGKIGIPDTILLKPGKLDQQEWEIMKEHPRIGAKILEGSPSEYIKLGEQIALTHHEKWDGTGYPRGLKGSTIPLAGRVAAIADVFDGVTSKRPYRKQPFSMEKTFELINTQKGKHFDPHIVDSFISLWDEILSIKEKYKDTGESFLTRFARNT